jgi:hypothetical protein
LQDKQDLIYHTLSKLQSKCNRATIKDLVYANQAIDEAGEHSNQGIIYKSDAINWKNCSIVTVSDASWSNEDEQVKKKVQKYKSQRARMTILVNPDFLKNQRFTSSHGSRLSSEGSAETHYKQRPMASTSQSKRA